MNVGQYISNTRTKLSDDVQPYRVATERITASLKEALRRARQVRPSLSYADGVLVPEASDVDFTEAISTTVRTELDPYSEALVFIAAARVLMDDNADTLNIAVAEKWKANGLEILAI